LFEVFPDYLRKTKIIHEMRKKRQKKRRNIKRVDEKEFFYGQVLELDEY